MNRLILSVLLSLNTLGFLLAQNKGLNKPQNPSTLPISRVAFLPSKPLPKIQAKAELINTPTNEWVISNGWELAAAKQIQTTGREITTYSYNTNQWVNATVPGTILTSLVNCGIYPDPLYGLNNLSIPDSLCRTDWWYRTLLPLPENITGSNVQLVLNGINYSAEVWLNGVEVGKIRGAFIRGIFDITSLIRKNGQNVLAIHILPPPNPGIPQEQYVSDFGANGGVHCYDGPAFICTEGWDWIPGIRDRNMGIWQDVRLRITSNATLSDPQVITELPLPDTTSAAITIKTFVSNKSSKDQSFTISGEIHPFTISGDIESVHFEKNISLKPNENRILQFSPNEFEQLNFKKPRLWWPNGYGRQELYSLKLMVKGEDNVISDTKVVRFGIREMSYDFTVDYQNARKNVRVNLNPIKVWKKTEKIITYRAHNFQSRQLSNGVNIGFVPDLKDTSLFDAGITPGSAPYLVIHVNGKPVFCRGGNWGLDDAMKRVSRDRLEPYFRLHKDAGFTMIRNWVGQSTEEVFYDLADEYGLLIWNDFWMSTENYNLDPWDNQLMMNNVRDVIRRFRNHPSIALWCGRNEGNPPIALDDSLHIVQAREDGTRIYHSSSIKNNLTNSGPWFYADFVKKEIHQKDGFNTETGCPAIPVAETMREMMTPEDVWPIGDAWYYHDLHRGQTDYIKAIGDQYGSYKDLEEFCRKAQMLNYEIYREIFEVWNYRLWNGTSGLLLWMSHPAWPSTVWQTYSSDYETNGVFYGSKKACEPLHVQFQPDANDVFFINTTLHDYSGIETDLIVYDLTAKELYRQSVVSDSKANSRIRCLEPVLPVNLPEVYLVSLKSYSGKGELLSENFYIRSANGKKDYKGLNSLAKVTLKGRVTGKKLIANLVSYSITVQNPSKTVAVSIKLNARDALTGKRILPAYISDGYFSLLPGETRNITVECPVNRLSDSVKISAEGFNVPLQEIIRFKR